VAELPLSLRLIRQLHRILMTDVRGADKQPGEFRKVQVGIGRPARYVPPPPQLLGDPLANFERQLHSEAWSDPLVRAFIMHYQFEAIHPFRDGNGRVGRLLLAILAEEWCELSDQWLYMSSYFLDNRDAYHDGLLRVSTHGDWTGWVRFCLAGAAVSARDTDARCQRLLALKERYASAAAEGGGSYRLSSIIDGLFDRPVVTVPDVRDRCDITYPTAQSDIARLVDVGVLTETATGRPKSFVASGLLEAIYE
jgi:Fic family protein